MVSLMTTNGSKLPRYDDLPGRARRAGRILVGAVASGKHDVFGCLNLMTPGRAVEAAKLIQRGAVFPLNWDMRMPDPPLFSRARFEHEVTGEPPSIGHDDVLHGWNTQS